METAINNVVARVLALSPSQANIATAHIEFLKKLDDVRAALAEQYAVDTSKKDAVTFMGKIAGFACVAWMFSIVSTANASSLWDRWAEFGSSWGSAELEFSCSYVRSRPQHSQYRVSKPVVGELKADGYGDAMAWDRLEVLTVQEGGFYFSDRITLAPEDALAVIKNTSDYKSFVDTLERQFDEQKKSTESDRISKLDVAKRRLEDCKSSPLPAELEHKVNPDMSDPTSDLERAWGKEIQCRDLILQVMDLKSSYTDNFQVPDVHVTLADDNVAATVGIDFKKGVAELLSSEGFNYQVALANDPAKGFAGRIAGITGTLGTCHSD